MNRQLICQNKQQELIYVKTSSGSPEHDDGVKLPQSWSKTIQSDDFRLCRYLAADAIPLNPGSFNGRHLEQRYQTKFGLRIIAV